MAAHEIPIRLDRVNGGVGFDVDQQSVVIRVTPGGPADGKVQVGDKVVRLFGETVQSGAHFNALLLNRAINPVVLAVFRKDERKDGKDGARLGYEFKNIVLVWNPHSGQKLGLAIKSHEGSVFISTVEPSSLCSLHLVEGDRVILVDGKPATNKDTARQLIVQGFQQNHRVTLLVERAIDDAAKSEASAVLSAVTNHDPSVVMNSDVLEIAKRQKERLERKDVVQAGKPLLRAPGDDKTPAAHVAIKDAHNSKAIGMDHESQRGNLMSVPKKM
ncbi:PDZ domain-containing protein [Aphelenchoides avenae]|nr:PDZ domain-containing protein [Aphelenchus avenae]